MSNIVTKTSVRKKKKVIIQHMLVTCSVFTMSELVKEKKKMPVSF